MDDHDDYINPEDIIGDDFADGPPEKTHTHEGVDPFFVGAAFGLGFEMGQDEWEFKGIHDEPEEAEEEVVIKKVPLSDRFISKGGRKPRPFLRWLADVGAGRKKHTDEIEYTKEEIWKILDEEGRDE
jgi:hypothetical protein